MKITAIESLHCDAGWRNFSFLTVSTDTGLVGWSEYNESYGSKGLSAVNDRLAEGLIGEDPRPIEKLSSRLYASPRQAPGGVNQQAIGAIENALLDVMAKDPADWAAYAGIKITWEPTVFIVNAVKCMRGCIAAGCLDKIVDHARAVFEAYWGDDQDVSQDDVLGAICDRIGLDRDAFFAAIAEPEIKDELKANTAEVVERGGFGSPTIFVSGEDMYFGNDRMPLVRAAVARLA